MIVGVMFFVTGCRAPVNPSFDLTMRDAIADTKRMAAAPVTLQRPVVVLAGWQDPGVGSASVAAKLRKMTGDDRIISVSFFFNMTFEACRIKTINHVREAFGDDVEVDVIGVSMGGIIARYAAMDQHDQPLRIKRLFTLSTPHRGARIAAVPFPDPRARDMKARSPFMQRLDAASRTYPIIPYVRLHDFMVGVHNASPLGDNPWWVSRPMLQPSHLFSFTDARLLADIARQLRGEEPFTHPPAAALP